MMELISNKWLDGPEFQEIIKWLEEDRASVSNYSWNFMEMSRPRVLPIKALFCKNFILHQLQVILSFCFTYKRICQGVKNVIKNVTNLMFANVMRVRQLLSLLMMLGLTYRWPSTVSGKKHHLRGRGLPHKYAHFCATQHQMTFIYCCRCCLGLVENVASCMGFASPLSVIEIKYY